MATDYLDVCDTLLTSRNNNWLPFIKHYFKTDEIELVLVGAVHLVSDIARLQLLEQTGYAVDQL